MATVDRESPCLHQSMFDGDGWTISKELNKSNCNVITYSEYSEDYASKKCQETS
jgi:hypothetical protein